MCQTRSHGPQRRRHHACLKQHGQAGQHCRCRGGNRGEGGRVVRGGPQRAVHLNGAIGALRVAPLRVHGAVRGKFAVDPGWTARKTARLDTAVDLETAGGRSDNRVRRGAVVRLLGDTRRVIVSGCSDDTTQREYHRTSRPSRPSPLPSVPSPLKQMAAKGGFGRRRRPNTSHPHLFLPRPILSLPPIYTPIPPPARTHIQPEKLQWGPAHLGLVITGRGGKARRVRPAMAALARTRQHRRITRSAVRGAQDVVFAGGLALGHFRVSALVPKRGRAAVRNKQRGDSSTQPALPTIWFECLSAAQGMLAMFSGWTPVCYMDPLVADALEVIVAVADVEGNIEHLAVQRLNLLCAKGTNTLAACT